MGAASTAAADGTIIEKGEVRWWRTNIPSHEVVWGRVNDRDTMKDGD